MNFASASSVSASNPVSNLDTTLRVLIADDEQLSRQRLKRFLRDERNIEVVAECVSGTEAVNAIRQHAPDVVFLDVQMPEMDAFDVLEELKHERVPAIIFVTAYDRFALRAFEIEAVDYLLKPFDQKRFAIALRRARHRLRLETAQGKVAAIPRVVTTFEQSSKPVERLTVKSSGRITIIKTREIDWISAADNYVELHVGNQAHYLRLTLRALADRLSQQQFARISRSIVVNLDRVKEIHSKSHGDFFVVLHSGTRLPGSRNFRSGLDGLLKQR